MRAADTQHDRWREQRWRGERHREQEGDRATRPRARPRPMDDRRRHIRVLLVDDHRLLREGLAGVLEREPDLEVVGQAADGLDALEMARELHPDVILMDVTMPRMSGIEATRRISHEMPDIRIVGLSMHEAEEIGAAMRRAGASDYIMKDGPSDELISAIRHG